MAKIELRNITKQYGQTEVLHKIDFSIENKEFIVILGPSGCGKSTLLRMIAGLEEISGGEIIIDGLRVDILPPKDRGCAMVFQNYALYPHMTVRGNIGYSLRIAKVGKKERRRRVNEVASMLDLSHLLDRKPGQLSGGQRQRVAIGRALVREPELFLFDEPLSNLDAKLRNSTRVELKKLHDKLGATTIYVTHDQVEAMTLADRIIILNNGAIEQIGTPKEIYSKPATRFVAGFIGTPQTNLIEGVINGAKTEFTEKGGTVFQLPPGLILPTYRDEVVLGIRPEDITIGGSTVTAGIEIVEELGSHRILHCKCGQSQISVVDRNEQFKTAGEEINLGFPHTKLHFFERESGQQL